RKKQAIFDAQKPSKRTLRPVPEKSKNFDTTENLYIEGDNLEVLKLLQKSYNSKVKLIYIVIHSLLKYCPLSILRLRFIG
ncbi:hypothetical protein, partial [Heyndrickxia sporothermodurans]|uniref:hypothetical protein n=1 Tax=Heyndrickxia sporothermodurans TaxID=46224 RepID=UPI00196AC4E4